MKDICIYVKIYIRFKELIIVKNELVAYNVCIYEEYVHTKATLE